MVQALSGCVQKSSRKCVSPDEKTLEMGDRIGVYLNDFGLEGGKKDQS